jgi:hypothetical protein
MKKTEMQHPKLYLSVMKNKNHQIEATYVSNRFGTSGDLKEQSTILDDIDANISIESILIHVNRIELKKLDIYISRQEKVVSTYKNKGKTEQFRIVSDSLELLIELRSTFKNWFNEMECTI